MTAAGSSKLQWGHGDEAVEELAWRVPPPRLVSCFNGATAMKPWKREMSIDAAVGRIIASMGPRR